MHGPQAWVCPARGGPAWYAWRTRHFEIHSDASPRRVAELAGQLEELQAKLVTAMAGEGAEVTGRTVVVAIDDPWAFRDLAGQGVAGYHLRTGLEAVPTVVLPTAGLGATARTVVHELVHDLSWSLYRRQPLWFQEGQAEFLETVAVEDSLARGRFGAFDRSRAFALQRIPLLPARQVLTAGSYPRTALEGQFHLSAWALYHFLWNDRTDDLSDYRGRLARGEAPEAAWRAAFPDLDPSSDGAMAGLDSLVAAYLRSGRYGAWTVEAPFDATLEPLGPVASGDVHQLLRRVRRDWGPRREVMVQRALADLEEQLAEAPHHPDALLARAELTDRDAEPDLRRSVAAHPGDWRAWRGLAIALRRAGGPERRAEAEAADRRALALSPDQPAVLGALARALVEDGRSGEALPLARRAAALAPYAAWHLEVLVAVDVDLGRCAEALALQARIVDLRPTAEDPRRELAALRVRCGLSPEEAAPPSGAPRP